VVCKNLGLLIRSFVFQRTEYGDDILRHPKHSIDLGPPRPNAGLGERGQTHSWSSHKCSEILMRRPVSGFDSAERYPPHPPALPRWGEGSRCSRLVAVPDQLVEVAIIERPPSVITVTYFTANRAAIPSFPRKRESRISEPRNSCTCGWIPACTGRTEGNWLLEDHTIRRRDCERLTDAATTR
jgi:hypothetical protein